MPLPVNIQAMLDTASPTFNPASTRKEYDDFKLIWRTYLDLYELDQIKLAALIEKHNDGEDPKKYALRQALAVVYNLVPTIINMARNYLFSEAPVIASTDPKLQAVIDDCDGNGTSLQELTKTVILPLCQVMGFVDVVVEHPNTIGEGLISAADVTAANLKPHVVPFTPLDRINWSCSPDGGYNSARYIDVGDEGLNPFVPPAAGAAYVTFAVQEKGNSFWVRSTNPAGSVAETYEHDGDLCPMRRVPIATLFHQRSIDRQQRRHGISKIAVIAILTKSIIQILSWTTEDVLANLAILALPTEKGRPAQNDDGSPAITSLGVFSILTFPKDGKNTPFVLQGNVDHIDFKLKLVELHLREIMRIANLMVAAGDAKQTTSGVQGVVERNELFRELKDTAGSLDKFTLEVLALAASWIDNKDVAVKDLGDRVTVRYFNGPFTTEPLTNILDNGEKVLALMGELSPTTCEAALKQVARAVMDGDAETLRTALDELKGAGKRLPDPPAPTAVEGAGVQPTAETDVVVTE